MTWAAGEQFEPYGPTHLVVLGIFVIGAAVMVLAGRRLRGRPAEQGVRRVFAVALLCVTIPVQISQLVPGEWDLQSSLPLHLCDLAWVFTAYALWTGHQLSAVVTYLWGITLTSQGMLTPELASNFPDPRFFMFWAMHLLIVWAAFFLVLGLRILPTWHTYRQTIAITVAWALSAYVFNVVFGTNYGYLNRLPRSASLLDYLGPWPVYVVLEIVIIAAVWALLTWPWVRSRRVAA